mmetsp:Transcript_11849/g.33390  ORF Transcript_11849/g.33390 Transcript_11849/m.33390 type:complete len:88 (+) Transcript_11849:57-320(+)
MVQTMQEMGVVSANMELEVTVGLALTVQEVAEKLPLLDAFEDCIRRLDRHSPHIASMEHTLLCATVSREVRFFLIFAPIIVFACYFP